MNAGIALQRMLNANTGVKSEEHNYKHKPFGATVDSINTENDSMKVSGMPSMGTPTVGIPHPFSGTGSWIRAYPENGSTVMMHERADDNTFIPLGYYRDSAKATRRDAQDAKLPTTIYRKMFSSEIEISVGKGANRGQAYFDQNGNVEIRSGFQRIHLNTDRLECLARTGTHIRQITPGNQVALLPNLGDEERFGLIKRSTKNPFFESYFGHPTSKLPFAAYISGTGIAAGKEYIRIIKAKPILGAPSALPILDYREGTTVVDDFGAPDVLPIGTIPPLPGPFRFKGSYYDSAITKLEFGMSLAGSLALTLPNTPSASFFLNAPGAGASINMNCQALFNVQSIAGPMTLTSGSALSLTASAAWSATGSTVSVTSSGTTTLTSTGVTSLTASSLSVAASGTTMSMGTNGTSFVSLAGFSVRSFHVALGNPSTAQSLVTYKTLAVILNALLTDIGPLQGVAPTPKFIAAMAGIGAMETMFTTAS